MHQQARPGLWLGQTRRRKREAAPWMWTAEVCECACVSVRACVSVCACVFVHLYVCVACVMNTSCDACVHVVCGCALAIVDVAYLGEDACADSPADLSHSLNAFMIAPGRAPRVQKSRPTWLVSIEIVLSRLKPYRRPSAYTHSSSQTFPSNKPQPTRQAW